MPRPFLLLSIREEAETAADEYASFLRFSGLTEAELHRVSLPDRELGEVELASWAGIFLGGGPYTTSDPEQSKSPAQVRAERELAGLLTRVVDSDTPFLGACYGIGTLGGVIGARIDRKWPEPVGPLSVELTEAGLADPVFAGMPREFAAYGGHKEAASWLPETATVLATSAACPVQAFRVGQNVYATQFHPELDLGGLQTRTDAYKHHGYFPPEAAEELMTSAARVQVEHPMTVLANFAARYHD